MGDRVRVYAGDIIPRDGIITEGKAFIDESMMTGESNPAFKEKDNPVLGGTKVASDKIVVEITAEAGKSFLDEMVSLIESATRPKTKNEIDSYYITCWSFVNFHNSGWNNAVLWLLSWLPYGYLGTLSIACGLDANYNRGINACDRRCWN